MFILCEKSWCIFFFSSWKSELPVFKFSDEGLLSNLFKYMPYSPNCR